VNIVRMVQAPSRELSLFQKSVLDTGRPNVQQPSDSLHLAVVPVPGQLRSIPLDANP